MATLVKGKQQESNLLCCYRYSSTHFFFCMGITIEIENSSRINKLQKYYKILGV